MIGYLSINSLRKKIIDLRDVLKHISFDYFLLSVIKLYNWKISDYEIRARREGNKYRGGLIEFLEKGLICKRYKTFRIVNNECICSESTISNIKWVFLVFIAPILKKLWTCFLRNYHLP